MGVEGVSGLGVRMVACVGVIFWVYGKGGAGVLDPMFRK